MSEKKKDDFMIREGGPWSSAWKIAAGIGGVGAVLSGVGAASDMTRFAFAYVFAYFCFLTIALGSVFFVLVQRLTSAGWSVTVRRTAEFFAYGLIAMAVLALPIIANLNRLCPMLARGAGGAEHASVVQLVEGEARADLPPGPPPTPSQSAASIGHNAPSALTAPTAQAAAGHAASAAPAPEHTAPVPDHAGAAPADHAAAAHAPDHGDHAAAGGHEGHDPNHVAHEETLEKKSPWFATNFFYGRAVFYLVVWIALAVVFFGYSTKQDKSKDPKLTLAAQSAAPVATMFFALSLTFAAFDWVMALEPSWFSTIFGVYIFATSVVSSLAVIILVTMGLRDAGYLKSVVTVEHYHDLGKLLFGFNVFWAYIGFSQFMLIWYAALPEETIFYHMRWDSGPWAYLSMILVFGHFVFPFFLLMSRHAKRTHLGRLKLGAGWLLAMHVVEWYWLVLPNLKDDFKFHWMDATCLLAVGGIYLAFVFHRMTKHPLIPVGDPRLQRSIHFQNA